MDVDMDTDMDIDMDMDMDWKETPTQTRTNKKDTYAEWRHLTVDFTRNPLFETRNLMEKKKLRDSLSK